MRSCVAISPDWQNQYFVGCGSPKTLFTQCAGRYLGMIRSKSLCFPSPTSYMLWSFGRSLRIWGVFSRYLSNDGYSNLPLKYPFKFASQLSAQKKSGFRFYCLNMSCKIIFRECINFVHLTFNCKQNVVNKRFKRHNVNLLTCCWNVSNGRCNSSYICLASIWTPEQSNWSSMSKIVLCRLQSLWSRWHFQIQQMSR